MTMQRRRQFTAKQLNALFSVCLVMLFGVVAHVNVLDSIEHTMSDHHHEHSIFSLVDTDHHDSRMATSHDDENSDKSDHSHPNLTGSVLFPDLKHSSAQQAYGVSAPIAWQRFDALQTNITLAHERPPKALA